MKIKNLLLENKNNLKSISQVKKILSGPEFSMKDRVYMKGSNLVVLDTFFYDANKALDKLIASWKRGGSYYDYFKDEYGADIQILDTLEQRILTGKLKKAFGDLSVVGVILTLKK